MSIDLSLPAGCTHHHARAHDRFYCEILQIFHIRGATDHNLNEAVLAYEDDLICGDGTREDDIFERIFMHIVTLRTQILIATPNQAASPMTKQQKIAWAGKHLPSPFVHLLTEETHVNETLKILCLAAALPTAQAETFQAFQGMVDLCMGEWAGRRRAPAVGKSTMAEMVKVVGGRGGVTGKLGGGIVEDGAVRRAAAVGGVWSLHDVRYMKST